MYYYTDCNKRMCVPGRPSEHKLAFNLFFARARSFSHRVFFCYFYVRIRFDDGSDLIICRAIIVVAAAAADAAADAARVNNTKKNYYIEVFS